MVDQKDKMIDALMQLSTCLGDLNLSPGETAGMLTFYIKYLCAYQPDPDAAVEEFIERLRVQTLPEAILESAAKRKAEMGDGPKGMVN